MKEPCYVHRAVSNSFNHVCCCESDLLLLCVSRSSHCKLSSESVSRLHCKCFCIPSQLNVGRRCDVLHHALYSRSQELLTVASSYSGLSRDVRHWVSKVLPSEKQTNIKSQLATILIAKHCKPVLDHVCDSRHRLQRGLQSPQFACQIIAIALAEKCLSKSAQHCEQLVHSHPQGVCHLQQFMTASHQHIENCDWCHLA